MDEIRDSYADVKQLASESRNIRHSRDTRVMKDNKKMPYDRTVKRN